MTHDIFPAPMLLTENVIDKAGLGIAVSSFSQIRVFSSGLGVWWWAAALVYEVDRYRLHLNHGIQGLWMSTLAMPWLHVEGRRESSPPSLSPAWALASMGDGAGMHPWCPPRGPLGAAGESQCALQPWSSLALLFWCMRNEKVPFLHSLFSVLLLYLTCSHFFETHVEKQSD